jgi:PAS domain-containing protein
VSAEGGPTEVAEVNESLRPSEEVADAAAGFALRNLRLAERRNRALLDAIPDTILRYRRDGTYLDVRPDAETAHLFGPEEFIGRNVRDVLPDELARTVLACIARARERKHAGDRVRGRD